MELGKTNQGNKTPECGAVGEKYPSSKGRNGKDIRERTDAPSLDVQIVYSIFCCGVLKGRKEVIEAGFMKREENNLLLIFSESGLIKGDSCW